MTSICEFPPELDDRQLLAYLDGRAGNDTLSHLAGCPYCSERARVLDRLQKRLAGRLYRIDCPAPEELGEYYLHTLPASRMLVLAQHVRGCPHCAREVSHLEGYLSDLAPVAPDSLLGKAKVLVARLVGGGQAGMHTETAGHALRGETKGPITFAADGIVIVLDVQPDRDGKVSVLGQVAGEDQDDWTGSRVELQREGQFYASSTVDDLGAFQFAGLTSGLIQMTITSPGGVIVQIANIAVGP